VYGFLEKCGGNMVRSQVLLLILVINLLILLAGCGDDSDDREQNAFGGVITTAAAWTPSDESIVQLHECRRKEISCVELVLAEHDASPEALKFFRATQWLLTAFFETGEVDVAELTDPWRANANVQYALVNGSPTIVLLEDANPELNVAIEARPALRALFPRLEVWPSSQRVEAVEEDSQEGQVFLVQYALNDGCNACSTGYVLRAALHFAADGTNISDVPVPVEGVCVDSELSAEISDFRPVEGIEECPAPSFNSTEP
jgi:hypothetical protein